MIQVQQWIVSPQGETLIQAECDTFADAQEWIDDEVHIWESILLANEEQRYTQLFIYHDSHWHPSAWRLCAGSSESNQPEPEQEVDIQQQRVVSNLADRKCIWCVEVINGKFIYCDEPVDSSLNAHEVYCPYHVVQWRENNFEAGRVPSDLTDEDGE